MRLGEGGGGRGRVGHGSFPELLCAANQTSSDEPIGQRHRPPHDPPPIKKGAEGAIQFQGHIKGIKNALAWYDRGGYWSDQSVRAGHMTGLSNQR